MIKALVFIIEIRAVRVPTTLFALRHILQVIYKLLQTLHVTIVRYKNNVVFMFRSTFRNLFLTSTNSYYVQNKCFSLKLARFSDFLAEKES